jgi:hypothetical protein
MVYLGFSLFSDFRLTCNSLLKEYRQLILLGQPKELLFDLLKTMHSILNYRYYNCRENIPNISVDRVKCKKSPITTNK